MRIYSTVTMCNINQAIPRKSVEAVVTVGYCYKWETQLMNEENEWDHKISAEVKEGPADCIRMDEVRAAPKKMKRHKAPGLSGLVTEMIQATGDTGECFFWYRPTRVVPDQRPLNGRCCCLFFHWFQRF